jgi:hypothetical protein
MIDLDTVRAIRDGATAERDPVDDVQDLCDLALAQAAELEELRNPGFLPPNDRMMLGYLREQADIMVPAYHEMKAALMALVQKLYLTEKALSGLYGLAYAHGMSYSGPTYRDEIQAAEKLLGMEESER